MKRIILVSTASINDSDDLWIIVGRRKTRYNRVIFSSHLVQIFFLFLFSSIRSSSISFVLFLCGVGRWGFFRGGCKRDEKTRRDNIELRNI